MPNQGVWGRNSVVDPNIPPPGPAGYRFVAERVYASDVSGNRWMRRVGPKFPGEMTGSTST